MRHRCTFILSLTGLLLALAACGDDSPDGPIRAAPSTSSPAPPTVPTDALRQLEVQYGRLQSSHAAIAQIWEALGIGQQAQCGDDFETVNPASISAGDAVSLEDVAVLLRSAAVDLDQATDLWRAECANPRSTIPPDVIDRGRLASRAAGETLRQASVLLETVEP